MSIIRNHSGRKLLLLIILLGIIGLSTELLLLEHADSTTQLIPHVTLAIGLLAVVIVYFKPNAGTMRVFQVVMTGFIAIGILGLYLHYRGNVEFALERSPSLNGLPLLWKAMRGATPSLAPGALAQLGLLGILFTYRHPVLNGAITPEAENVD